MTEHEAWKEWFTTKERCGDGGRFGLCDWAGFYGYGHMRDHLDLLKPETARSYDYWWGNPDRTTRRINPARATAVAFLMAMSDDPPELP